MITNNKTIKEIIDKLNKRNQAIEQSNQARQEVSEMNNYFEKLNIPILIKLK